MASKDSKKRKIAPGDEKLSEEAKKAQKEVLELNERLKKEGQHIVSQVLPQKIAALTELLKDAIFNRSIQDIIPDLQYLDSLKPTALKKHSKAEETETETEFEPDDADAAVPKDKIKQENKMQKFPGSPPGSLADAVASSSAKKPGGAGAGAGRAAPAAPAAASMPRDSDSSEDEGTADLRVAVPCNEALVATMARLKAEVKGALEAVAVVKLWIQLMIPRIEDGNNFGVGVQEECLGELGRAEDQGFNALDAMNKYFQTRAKLVTKILRHPNIMDFRQAVLECDEMEYVNLKITALDLRNNYIIMYDLLHKNLERILKPRSSAGQEMMML